MSLVLVGCAFASNGSTTIPASSRQQVDSIIRHEPCSSENAVTVDLNFDGRPDRVDVYGAKTLACRAVDLNFDGSTDDWAYFDDKGAIRRRETDYDRDGLVDEVTLYTSGVVREKRRATTVHGRFDTWHFYLNGTLRQTRRDANGDGYVDQWWEYGSDRKAECPLIHSDVDGDGRPDPGATIDLCKLASMGDEEAGEEDNANDIADENVKPLGGDIPTELTPNAPARDATEGEPE